MQRGDAGEPRTRTDGVTPEQRFLPGRARVWRTLQRDEAARGQVRTGRVGPRSNMPELRAACGCRDGDRTVRPAEQRARSW